MGGPCSCTLLCVSRRLVDSSGFEVTVSDNSEVMIHINELINWYVNLS